MPPFTSPVIEVTGLHTLYGTTVADVSFTVHAREVFGVAGTNGADRIVESGARPANDVDITDPADDHDYIERARRWCISTAATTSHAATTWSPWLEAGGPIV